MTNKKGFTLVELLVVIGIIGVLATISVASLNSARQKARDTRRITDVKQMATILEAEDASIPDQALVGCTTAAKKTTDCTAPGAISQFPGIKDPRFSDKAACASANKTDCAYAISTAGGLTASKTSDYQICFYLESAGGGLGKGLHRITINGLLEDNCKDGGGLDIAN